MKKIVANVVFAWYVNNERGEGLATASKTKTPRRANKRRPKMLVKVFMQEGFDNLSEDVYEEMRQAHGDWYERVPYKVLSPAFASLVAAAHNRCPSVDDWTVRAGLHNMEAGFGWLRCSGTFVWVVDSDPMNDFNATLILSGRRHSVREIFQMFFPANWREHVERYEYVSTWREDLAPWETAT